LWRLPAGGGAWTQLTADAITDRAPKFSSDGTQIVFHSFHEGSQDIRVMPAHGRPGRYLAVSPAHRLVCQLVAGRQEHRLHLGSRGQQRHLDGRGRRDE
jgi:hypothetical protein